MRRVCMLIEHKHRFGFILKQSFLTAQVTLCTRAADVLKSVTRRVTSCSHFYPQLFGTGDQRCQSFTLPLMEDGGRMIFFFSAASRKVFSSDKWFRWNDTVCIYGRSKTEGLMLKNLFFLLNVHIENHCVCSFPLLSSDNEAQSTQNANALTVIVLA